MSDNGLPKATMVNYIKDRISDKRKVSAEFTNLLLDLSKQFIDKVSAQANQICQKEGKKTINNEHFFGALKKMGMSDIITELQKIDQSLKMKQQKKQQDKQRVQENILKIKSIKSEMEEQQPQAKQRLPILQARSKHEPINIGDQDHNSICILEDDQLDQAQQQNDQKFIA